MNPNLIDLAKKTKNSEVGLEKKIDVNLELYSRLKFAKQRVRKRHSWLRIGDVLLDNFDLIAAGILSGCNLLLYSQRDSEVRDFLQMVTTSWFPGNQQFGFSRNMQRKTGPCLYWTRPVDRTSPEDKEQIHAVARQIYEESFVLERDSAPFMLLTSTTTTGYDTGYTGRMKYLLPMQFRFDLDFRDDVEEANLVPEIVNARKQIIEIANQKTYSEILPHEVIGPEPEKAKMLKRYAAGLDYLARLKGNKREVDRDELVEGTLVVFK
jgi:hypothetical protein